MYGNASSQLIGMAAYDSLPCEILSFDSDLECFLGANQRVLDNLGIDFKTLQARKITDIFDFKFIENTRALRKGSDSMRLQEPFIASMRRVDGTSYESSITLAIVLDPQPTFVAVGIDISKRRAAEKDAEIARRTLEASIDALPHGFVLYDREDRLVICNEQYRRFYPLSAHSMRPGAQFQEILQTGLDAGEYLDALGREAAWLAERLRDHRVLDKTVFQNLSNGRRLQIIERITPDGGRVGLRMDISDLVESRERAERAEQRLLDAIDALPAGFWLFDDKDQLVLVNDEFRNMYGSTAETLVKGRSYQDILWESLAAGQFPDAIGREEECFKEIMEKRSRRCYEIIYRLDTGRWVHSLNTETSEGGIVGFRVDITELKKQELRQQKAADTDSLTGLLNRRGAQTAIEQLRDNITEVEKIAFIHIDLDRFKPINDLFGHQAGDSVLRSIAMSLEKHTDDSAVVARIGGDEFLVAHVIKPSDSLDEITDKVHSAVVRPILINGQVFHVGASVGVAIWSSKENLDLQDAAQNADIALNLSKLLGRNVVTPFQPIMRQEAVTRARIAEDVARGLSKGEFFPFYQPIYDAETHALSGFESLARWRHPDLGVLRPAYFLEASDMAGYTTEIDWAVLREAGNFAKALQKRGRPDLRISLNLSNAQIKSPKIVDAYLDFLKESNLEPAQFRIEILETTLLEEQTVNVMENIVRFHQVGFAIDLDDFGTGHTAIASLRKFPVDRIKIDRSLVSGIANDTELAILTDAIVALGRRLGLLVLAEGVESRADMEMLKKMGCTCFQGFLFAHPLPEESCLTLVDKAKKKSSFY